MKLYDRIFKPQTIALPNGHTVTRARSRAPFILLAFAVCVCVSWQVTGVDLNKLASRGYEFFVILCRPKSGKEAMFPPTWSYMPKVWQPLLDTIKMSLLGSIIGSTAALPIAVCTSSNIVKNRAVISVIRVALSFIRTLPTLIIALIATYIFGLGTFAGTVAISIFTFGIVAKMMYEQIETIDTGAFEATEALGATKGKAFMSAILPQVLPYYLSTCLYCFEINVRHAAILGYVGAGGLGLIINQTAGWREYGSVGMILVTLYITVFVIENVSKYLRSKLA